MDVGDIAYKNVAIELKSWSDFITALTSKADDRFRRQLYNFLINRDVEGYYFIYGDWSEINQYSQITPNAVLGALASIQARYGMRLMVFSKKVFAIYTALKVIEKTFDHKDVRPVTYRVGSDERAIDGLVAIGARVGSEDAIRLLEHFGTFRDVINATEKQMTEVHKIGKIKAKNLHKVIDYNFKSKQEFEEAIDEEFGVIDINSDKIIDNPESSGENSRSVDDMREVEKKDISASETLNPIGDDSKLGDSTFLGIELEVESPEGVEFNKKKQEVYNEIASYCKKNRKPCPFDSLKESLKIRETMLRQILNDLEVELLIYLVGGGKYNVF